MPFSARVKGETSSIAVGLLPSVGVGLRPCKIVWLRLCILDVAWADGHRLIRYRFLKARGQSPSLPVNNWGLTISSRFSLMPFFVGSRLRCPRRRGPVVKLSILLLDDNCSERSIE